MNPFLPHIVKGKTPLKFKYKSTPKTKAIRDVLYGSTTRNLYKGGSYSVFNNLKRTTSYSNYSQEFFKDFKEWPGYK